MKSGQFSSSVQPKLVHVTQTHDFTLFKFIFMDLMNFLQLFIYFVVGLCLIFYIIFLTSTTIRNELHVSSIRLLVQYIQYLVALAPTKTLVCPIKVSLSQSLNHLLRFAVGLEHRLPLLICCINRSASRISQCTRAPGCEIILSAPH